MTDSHQFDELLRNWPYEVDALGVRRVTCADDREVLQMRVDMGVLQLELEGRPDGTSPDGFVTFYDYLLGESQRYGDEMVLDDDQCNEVDREFIQFYQRRICWLRLQEYRSAVRDADHTLKLMDFCRKHSPDQEWTLSHEQQRPFVLFHRTQAAALLLLDESGPDTAISEINKGLDELRTVFEEFQVEDQYETDEFV
ncbi:MAG: DNA helicase UvrBC, partial [Pirellulaceae bacterium]|nr:DNA helicase UvrBC [Pirellulaceae bacterium]